MSRSEAQQLELIGMTSVVEIASADALIDSLASRSAVAASAESADGEAAGAASFETEE